jgi:hypothetical protein
MKVMGRVCAFLVFATLSTPALPWGAEGHEAVGAIADQLLEGTPAQQKVREILGFELKQAGPWADCIRSVEEDNGTFTYKHHPLFGRTCVPFETPSEKARMEDYARRNWTNCERQTGRACHAEYHFADVSVHYYEYKFGLKGTFAHDIVHAINAAIDVLRDKPAREPFSIKDKKEAIFMLAHFVGDLHQPLHVGSVYLDERGKLINPDGPQGSKAEETQGGNLLGDGPTMHSEWDRIPNNLMSGPNAALMAKAKVVPSTPGDIETWPSQWASDTVRASHTAFTGVTFSGNGNRWDVTYNDRTVYLETQDKMKRDQLAKGGARLAEVLKAALK